MANYSRKLRMGVDIRKKEKVEKIEKVAEFAKRIKKVQEKARCYNLWLIKWS